MNIQVRQQRDTPPVLFCMSDNKYRTAIVGYNSHMSLHGKIERTIAFLAEGERPLRPQDLADVDHLRRI